VNAGFLRLISGISYDRSGARRWRWFFLATSGLFSSSGGSEWGVSCYRMKKA
jgi:hypothetical protein